MLSRDKRLPFDTWNTSGLQENVFDSQFSKFHRLQGRGLFSQEMTNKVKTQFQCRHLQEGRRL